MSAAGTAAGSAAGTGTMPAFAALAVLLFVGHYVGDYVVQTDWWAALKVAGATYPPGHPAQGRPVPAALSWWWNQVHVATYTATIAATVAAVSAVGGFAGQLGAVPAWRWLAAAAANWAAHSLLDRRWPVLRLMEATGSVPFARNGGAAHVDQALHLLTLLLLAGWVPR
jgi:hypothetical protein